MLLIGPKPDILIRPNAKILIGPKPDMVLLIGRTDFVACVHVWKRHGGGQAHHNPNYLIS